METCGIWGAIYRFWSASGKVQTDICGEPEGGVLLSIEGTVEETVKNVFCELQ